MKIETLVPTLSVRTRIILLAAIPLVGFLAVGVAFTKGGRTIDAAMAAAHASTQVADTSRELKAALGQILLTATAYAAHPNEKGAQEFAAARQRAAGSVAGNRQVRESGLRGGQSHPGARRDRRHLCGIAEDHRDPRL
jgi:hypothetical protein